MISVDEATTHFEASRGFYLLCIYPKPCGLKNSYVALVVALFKYRKKKKKKPTQ